MVKEKKKCAEVGCEKDRYCRGLCTLHYQKLKRTVNLSPLYEEKDGLLCKAEGCKRAVYAKGLCIRHYNRTVKNIPICDDLLKTDTHLSVKERLEKNRVVKENGCIEWTKQKDKNGYGRISIKDKPYPVHRVSYETYIGEIKPGLLVLHKCDNPSCFNPEHLFLGTNKDNMEDMTKKGRKPIGEKVANSKLTEEQVREIKERLFNGETVNEIFPDYPVSG